MLGFDALGRNALGRIETFGANEFSLVGASGSFVLSGQDASVLAARRVVAEAGSIELSGQAATVYAVRIVLGDAGSFAVAGRDVGLLATRFLVASATPLQGAASSLLFSPLGTNALGGSLAADQAADVTFRLALQSAELRPGRYITADSGAIILDGAAAVVVATRQISGESGPFAISGQSAGVLAARRIAPLVGAFVLSGRTVDLAIRRRKILAFPRVGRLSGTIAARSVGGGMRARVNGG